MTQLFYDPTTDTMYVQFRDIDLMDAEDAGVDLIVHYGVDDKPAAFDIDHATTHPEHIVMALKLWQDHSAAEWRAKQADKAA